MRRDPNNWTPDVWTRVYGISRGRGEGWAGRRDGLFAGQFRADPDPKDGSTLGSAETLENGGY